jgi:hypothetical protein
MAMAADEAEKVVDVPFPHQATAALILTQADVAYSKANKERHEAQYWEAVEWARMIRRNRFGFGPPRKPALTESIKPRN